MKVLIAGLGSIGKRHLANLRALDERCQVVIWHQHSKPSDGPDPLSSPAEIVYSLDEALNLKPDAALITGPASTHVETGLDLARHGIHLFIEKPLSNAMQGVDALLDMCRQRKLTLMVGYNFRFYRPLQVMREALTDRRIGRVMTIRAEAGQYLPDWRPARDYRQTVSASRDLGGGVLLELSHELDYVQWLLGDVQSVWAHIGQYSDLEIDVEDVAEVILQFRNGAVGSVHLNMVQRSASRTCRIIGTDGVLMWDWESHRVRCFSAATGNWADLHPAKQIEHNDMYVSELRHFLDCIEKRQTPEVDGETGARVLQVALAAKRSSQDHRMVEL